MSTTNNEKNEEGTVNCVIHVDCTKVMEYGT